MRVVMSWACSSSSLSAVASSSRSRAGPSDFARRLARGHCFQVSLIQHSSDPSLEVTRDQGLKPLDIAAKYKVAS